MESEDNPGEIEVENGSRHGSPEPRLGAGASMFKNCEGAMIVRVWKGMTAREDGPFYASYIERAGIAGYRRTPGNVSAVLFSRTVGNHTEFLLVSMWSCMEAVERYAGETPEWAVFYPEDMKYLITYDATVRHYETVASDGNLFGPGSPGSGRDQSPSR